MESSRGWIEREVVDGQFVDERLDKRLRHLLEQLSDGPGRPIPFACQDLANTKAAYRFLSNPRVTENDILSGHFQATRERAVSVKGSLLVLHDTTEFSFRRDDKDSVGLLGTVSQYTVCGILMHSSLVISPEGLPLGLCAVKYWNRSRFKGTNALKRSINPTRVPIEVKESYRWLENLRQSSHALGDACRCVHIGDREADIYELFSLAHDLRTHFLIRTCVDRLAGDGEHTIADEIAEVPCKGLHRIVFTDAKGQLCKASLEIRYRRVKVLPPIGKAKSYPPLILTVLHATERNAPQDRKPIEWKLLTDLPVTSRTQAIEKIDWYAMRWKIETFHKILKSGCNAEDSKLRTAERLTNYIALLCIISWRIFWLTMLNRAVPDAKPTVALTKTEIEILDQLIPTKKQASSSAKSLTRYLILLAKLGGYLARTHDPPPGNLVIWRGMTKLADIATGFKIGLKVVGN